MMWRRKVVVGHEVVVTIVDVVGGDMVTDW
jgi:hypothetical protein